ncbi:unnamed protein product, partial [Clonostachys solani]
MATPSLNLAAYGIVPEDWTYADSCTDLASVYEELRRIDRLDQVVSQYLPPSLGAERETEVRWTSAGSWQYFSLASEVIRRHAAECIGRQREALRSRAVFLSRGQTRDVRLTDLSVELLVLIISNFRCSVVLKDITGMSIARNFPESNRQAVQSLRLVSRLFNSLASPLLCPIIRLSLDQKSLDHVQNISSNPLLASGVRSIRIGLAYRPTVLARSFDRWLEHHNDGSSIIFMSSSLARAASAVERSQGFGDEAMEAYARNIRQHSSRARPDGLDKTLDEEQVSRYEELLRKCYEGYSRAYEVQAQLLSERSFIGAVARLAAQASHPILLELFDTFESELGGPIRGGTDDQTIFRSELIMSTYYTASPVHCSQEQYVEDDEQQHQAVGIISDLPIAIHQAGGVVNAFQLSYALLAHPLSAMADLPSRDWEGVNAAFQQLKVLNMPRIQVHRRQEPSSLSKTQKKTLDDYFSALLSSQHLEEVIIDGTPYTTGWADIPATTWSSLGRLLGGISWPQIKSFKLSGISMTQTQMEGLFQDWRVGAGSKWWMSCEQR